MHIWEQIPQRERRDLLIAWLALSAAFTVAMIGTSRLIPTLILEMFVISMITAGVAFIVHEMAHKFTAMRYGYWAEFQMNPTMLVVAVAVAALAKVVFAAPGATMIYGSQISEEENGKISLAGPLSNLLLLIPFSLLLIVGINIGIFEVALVGIMGIRINAMIAAFNLLPLGPLDGAKILPWNTPVYIAMVLIAFAILFSALNYNLAGPFF
ncbi:MAG TPA: peptidase M50 [Methanospirillum sp.]|uniref:peptidase M50 n=1 Tax=Methanospirillum sp. TaxID=45200 RepID=UPI002C7D7219|nr:peptidase M50 [Methanospirillum sp.]HWQ64436.1 peptidase M50 [Methanospirillum sp.]